MKRIQTNWIDVAHEKSKWKTYGGHITSSETFWLYDDDNDVFKLNMETAMDLF